MRFVKQLLVANKKNGFIFIKEEGMSLQIRAYRDSHLCWEKFVSYAEIELDSKTSHMDIPKTVCWELIIPAYQCTTKYIVLPSDDPLEIEKMLEYELPNIVSYNSQPWVWDFSIIERQKDGSSRILITLSPVHIIDHHIKTLLSLGIKPNAIIHNAMFYAFLLIKQEIFPKSNPRGCFCLCDEHLDFFIIEDEKLTFFHSVRLGKKFHEETRFIEAEIQRVFSMVKEHKFVGYPGSFCVINTGRCSDDFAKTVEKISGFLVEKVELDLYSKTDGLTPVNLDNYLSADPKKNRINLLPRPLKEKQLSVSRHRRWVKSSLKICLVLFLALLCLKTSIWRKNRMLERYEQRLSEISPVAEQLQLLQQQLSIIKNQLQGNISMLDIIFELYKSLPKDITVHYLNVEQNGKVRIRAQAKLLSQAFDCIGLLEKSYFFQNVRQSYANQRQIENNILIDFEIITDLQKRDQNEDSSEPFAKYP